MTPLSAALAWFELTVGVPVAALAVQALSRAARKLHPLIIQPQVDPTVVLHEAGHALLAWHCTAVDSVLSVNTRESAIGGPGGYVKSAWLVNAPQPALDWCRLVVVLGGVAAEMMVARRARSGPASEDLMAAADLSRRIVQAGGADPPWSESWDYKLAFERVFVEQLSDAEMRVLRIGYAAARGMLARRPTALARLEVLLAERHVATGEELRAALGKRPVASTGLWRTLSGEIKAEFVIPA